MKKVLPILAAFACCSLLALAADTPATQPKTFKPDAEGYIRNWLVLDPIGIDVSDHTEEIEKPLFAKEYFKEQLAVLPKADEKVTVAGKSLQWRAAQAEEYGLDLAAFASDHGKDSESVLFWGITYVTAPEDLKDVKLAIGSDDSSVWWLNGKEVIRAYEGRALNPDDNVSQPLTLNKGTNVLRFAIIQGGGPAGGCARFLDAKDKPVTNYTVTLDPPAVPAK